MKTLAASAALFLALAPYTYGQQNDQSKKSLTFDAAVASTKNESHIFRAEGFYAKGENSLIGFIDAYGRETDNYYTEIYGRRDLRKGAGLQLELNDGRYLPAVFRAGAIIDVPGLPKNVYANVKILPLNVYGSGTPGELQVGTFASAELPHGWHVENWTDINLGNTKAPHVLTEVTATKTIKGRLSAVFRASYRVNTEGFGFRAGLRYKAF